MSAPGDDWGGRRNDGWPPDDHFRPARNGWRLVGIVLAVMLAVGGLLFVGAIVVLWMGMASYGSNK